MRKIAGIVLCATAAIIATQIACTRFLLLEERDSYAHLVFNMDEQCSRPAKEVPWPERMHQQDLQIQDWLSKPGVTPEEAIRESR